jgi:hypothetical protein
MKKCKLCEAWKKADKAYAIWEKAWNKAVKKASNLKHSDECPKKVV